MKRNHYGIEVDSEVPTTGVFHINSLEFILDDMYDAIDLDFEEHRKTCRKRTHDACYDSDGSQTELIGFKKIKGGKNRGKWAPDPKADHARPSHLAILVADSPPAVVNHPPA